MPHTGQCLRRWGEGTSPASYAASELSDAYELLLQAADILRPR